MSESTGALLSYYGYEAFGSMTQVQGTEANPRLYAARDFDSETGIYYDRARYYDPSAGRFISEDPIGFKGGGNFYAYVGNNATNLIDPSGLCGKAPNNYPQLSKNQCSAMQSLLARESQYGTANAAHMSSNTFGDGLLTPFNSTFVPNLQTPVGNLDLDWFTDIRSYSNYANAVNPIFGTAGLYTVAKLSWTAIRAHAGMAIGNAIPFTDPGERTAVVQATLGASYASIFTPAYMAQVCK